MRRLAMAVSLLAALVLAVAAGGAPSRHGRSSTAKAGDEDHDLGRLDAARAERVQEPRRGVRREEPRRDVKVVGGINDDKIIAAIRGGNAPDVVSSFTSENVGIFCPTGGWIDLGP